MALPVTLFRLVSEPDEPGVYCGKNDLKLGGVALLALSADGLAPRTEDELQAIFDAAYGVGSIDASTRLPGLQAVGNALNSGDLCRATICSLLLKLPDIDQAGIDRLAEFAVARKANFNPAEPRRAGRWAISGAANANIVSAQLAMPFPPPGIAIPGYPGGPKRKDDEDFVFPISPQSGTGHQTNSQSRTDADADAKATTTEDEPELCPDSSFEPTSVSRTDEQRLYQAQIAQLPLDFHVVLNGTGYDGCRNSDLTLLEAKTDNGWYFGIPPDEFRTMKAYKETVDQAIEQIATAGKWRVEWHYNNPQAAYFWRAEFARLGLANISVEYTPADPFYEPPSVSKADFAVFARLYTRWG